VQIRIPHAVARLFAPRDPAQKPESAWRVMAILVAFSVVLWVGSDRLLFHAEPFWSACEPRCGTQAALPLRTEARLRTRDPGSVQLVVAGSSAARTDVDLAMLAEGLGLAPDEALRITIPRARPAELAMLSDEIVRLRPQVVLLVISVMTGYEPVAWDDVRFYDPGVARALVGWQGLLVDRKAHGTLALGSLHVLIRNRAGLRQAMVTPPAWPTEDQFWDHWDQEIAIPADAGMTLEPPAWDDFNWPNPQTRALGWMAERFAEHDIELVVAMAPTRTPWGLEPRITEPLGEFHAAEARAHGYRYLDGAEERLEGQRSYVDPFHLTEAGQRAYTEWLLEQLAAPAIADGGAP
jgi:hypothetical protein